MNYLKLSFINKFPSAWKNNIEKRNKKVKQIQKKTIIKLRRYADQYLPFNSPKLLMFDCLCLAINLFLNSLLYFSIFSGDWFRFLGFLASSKISLNSLSISSCFLSFLLDLSLSPKFWLSDNFFWIGFPLLSLLSRMISEILPTSLLFAMISRLP